MERILMIIMAVCAVLGALDRIGGNHFHLGERFEQGFRLLGPIALAQTGLICLAPVFSEYAGAGIAAAHHALGLDPGMFGSLLAIDMGGYQLAKALADTELTGGIAGIIAASTLGCTVSFTLPVGMELIGQEQQDAFLRGIVCGLIVLPAAILLGALLAGLDFLSALLLCAPVAFFSLVCVPGILHRPKAVIAVMRVLARLISAAATIGLALAAVRYMTGFTILPAMGPIEDAMAIAGTIGIVLLGAMPFAEILNRVLRKPMNALGRRIGTEGEAAMNLLVCLISVTPALGALKRFGSGGVTLNAAFSVCAASCLSSHLAFSLAVDSAMTGPMIAAKVFGGIAAAALAVCFMRRRGTQGA